MYLALSCFTHFHLCNVLCTYVFLYGCSQRGLHGVYRFYVKAVNPDITFGARDFYVLSVLLDSICFCLFVLGFSSFGVRASDTYYTCFCVHLCLCVSLSVYVHLYVHTYVCTYVCVCPQPLAVSALPPIMSAILPSLPVIHSQPYSAPSIASPLPLPLFSTCPSHLTTQLGQGNVEQVATYIQQSTIPLPFLIVLLLQFLFMLIDRVIYLHKSLPMKFIFNVFLIIAWHGYLFFILPYYTET